MLTFQLEVAGIRTIPTGELMGHHLSEYQQAMDEALAQLGVEPAPVTSWELFETEPGRVATAEAIAQKSEAWGEAISAAFRAIPSVDADVWE